MRYWQLTVGYATGHTEVYYSNIKRELVTTERQLVDMYQDQIDYTDLKEVATNENCNI